MEDVDQVDQLVDLWPQFAAQTFPSALGVTFLVSDDRMQASPTGLGTVGNHGGTEHKPRFF